MSDQDFSIVPSYSLPGFYHLLVKGEPVWMGTQKECLQKAIITLEIERITK